MTQQKAGFCPQCGNNVLDFSMTVLCGEEMTRPFHCLKCGMRGVEHFRVEFDYHSFMDGRRVGSEDTKEGEVKDGLT